MLLKIKKLQFICGLLYLMQVICFKWYFPFHLIAAILSIIIIGWQRKFCVLQVQYHYYVLGLYAYRLYLLNYELLNIFNTLYLVLSLYVSMMIMLFSFRAIL